MQQIFRMLPLTIRSLLRRMGYSILTGNGNYSFEPVELKCYDKLLDDWWYEVGKVRWLHTLNDIRVPLIYNAYVSSFHLARDYLLPRKDLRNIKLLDVGCGGGILSEALVNLGFSVTGIDPNNKMIVLAKHHAKQNKALAFSSYEYVHTTIEQFAPGHKDEFDGVVISEVLDRVVNKEVFLERCIHTLKPGGYLFITSKNKTFFAFRQLLVCSLIKTLPLEAQNWFLFIDPDNLTKILQKYKCSTLSLKGLDFTTFRSTFALQEYTDFWYYIQAVKK